MKTTTLALSRKPAESLFLWLALCFLLPILSASSATKVLTKSVPFNGKRAKTYTDTPSIQSERQYFLQSSEPGIARIFQTGPS